jgi:hypothetical protein
VDTSRPSSRNCKPICETRGKSNGSMPCI